jgi:hypothetical protein
VKRALWLALWPLAALAAEPQLAEIDVHYSVTYTGIGLGRATIQLTRMDGGNCYRYESITDPIWLVVMLYGAPHETSEFCIVNGKVVAKRFEFVNPKREQDSFRLEFDPARHTVRGFPRGDVREVPPDAQDRFGLQQAVRLWVLKHLDDKDPGTVEFPTVDDTRVARYTFAIKGRETVDTPAGTFDTVRVERIDDPKKTMKFWLAPERDYMPVKVHIKGKVEIHMALLPASPAGAPAKSHLPRAPS